MLLEVKVKQFLVLVVLYAIVTINPCIAGAAPVRVPGHIPDKIIALSDRIGPVSDDADIPLAINLPLRHVDELNALLKSLYDPKDPLYGHYLSTDEFITRFAPTQEDYDAVAAYAETKGFKITGRVPNRTLLKISGSALMVNNTFNITLTNYKSPTGRIFHLPETEPEVPADIASKIAGIVGLSNAAEWHSASFPSGQYGLSPTDIKQVYNVDTITEADGRGQILALLEFGSFIPQDIYNYEHAYGLGNVQLIPYQ